MNNDSLTPSRKLIAEEENSSSNESPLFPTQIASYESRQSLAKDAEEGDLERFFTLSLDMLCIAGFDGYFKRLNPVWEKTLGYTQVELLTHPYLEFIHPDDRNPTIAEVLRLTDEGANTFEFENRYRCKDGTYRWLLWNATPAPEKQLLYCIAHDITERKRTEMALQRQLEVDRMIANMSTRFINLPSDQISEGIDLALQEIGQFAGVDTCFVLRYEDNSNIPCMVREWVAEGLSPQMERAQLFPPELFTTDPFLHSHPQTQQGHVIEMINVADCIEVTPIKAFPYRSLFAVPMTYGGEVVGWVGLGYLKPIDRWSSGFKHLLRMVGEIITNALQRQQAETEIRQLNRDLEQRVLERTEQLAATNKELESFCYSVSHDLRAPLRAIDGFSQALLEDYDTLLDDIGRDFLQRIRQATQRMGNLIDDLLALSRVTRQELHMETVDLSRIAAEIVQSLQQSDLQRKVNIQISPTPAIRGDARLLRVMLENLLGNAWKFTSKTPQARIEFGTLPNSDRIVYFVRDNGAGFDMTYASKLFGAFQRLHSASDFPGTGIGLATVQRIVNRHRGRVWGESEVDRGATFCFTL